MKINISHILFALGLCFGLLIAPKAQAQQESQYTQYMYNTTSFNPAYAGTRESLTFSGLYRNQWVGLDGAPENLDFAAHSPIGVKGVGLGLGFNYDKLGPTTNSKFTADFAYVLQMNEDDLKLSFGVKGGLSMMNVDPNKLVIYNPNDYDLRMDNFSAPIFGVGLYLYTDNWYLGISTPNLLETKYYKEVQRSFASYKSHFYLIGGYVFDINPDLKLKPAALVKAVSGAPVAVDISLNALFLDRLTLGAAYRLDAAVSALAGFAITDNILIGYAYDYDTTPLQSYNSGSHEIFMRFELGTRSRPKVNPRFF